MTEKGRHLGAVTRWSIVLIYGLMAFSIANHLGRTDSVSPGTLLESKSETTTTEIRLKLDLSASRAVENWSVTVDGVTVDNGSSTEHRWSAAIDLAPLRDQRLVIDVTPTRLPEIPLAVKLTISSDGKTWEQTFWAPEELVELVSLDSLWMEWEVAP